MFKKSLFTSWCLFISLFLSNTVLAQQTSTGEFVQPQMNESFAGNLLFFVQASDETGIASVAIRFPQRNISRTLCQSNTSCNGTNFSGLLSGFNPNDFGFSEGSIQAELVVTDLSGSSVTADTISVNWSIPTITNVEGQRSDDGSELSVSWSTDSRFFRYNIYLAQESGITPTNARSLTEAQVRLIRRSSPEVFTDLEPTQTYYVLVTGIDSSGESGLSEVIEVVGLNVPPDAENDEFVIDEDVPATFDLLLNDLDENGDELELVSISGAQGALEIVSQRTVTYVPPENFNGDDGFTYTVADGNGGEASASVSITVLPINDAPVANADTAQTLENLPITISVLENDSDIENDLLQISAVSSPLNGDASSNGSQIAYTPNADFFGTDNFTYTVSDGNGGTASTSVTIDVQEVNAAPVAQNDSADAEQSVAIRIDVLLNDSDPDGDELMIINASAQNGSVVIQDGVLSYTSNDDFVGSDTITYTISDGSLTAQGTVSVNVVRQNAAPQASNDTAQVTAGQSVTINVLANDSDPDGDSLTVTSVSATSGAASVQGNQVRYTADDDFVGTATLTYVISDGELTDQASVSVAVSAANQAPQANDDSAQVTAGQSVTINVLANDSDPDGDSLTVTSVSATSGAASVQGNQVRYTADDDFVGTATLTYVISDGELTDEASVSVAVSAANQAPQASNDTAQVTAGQSVTINVLANDSDPDGDSLTVTSVSATSGAASVQGNQVRYTADDDFVGTATLTYVISDGELTDQASVSVAVSAANQAPQASNDTAQVTAGQSVTINVLANDSDPDGDSLTVTSVSATSGAASVQGNQVRYTADDGFVGTATLTYVISDGELTDQASVSVNVVRQNAAPQANDDLAQVTAGQSVTINVLANDSDPDGDSLTVTSVSATSGAASVQGNQVRYTADDDFVGTATLTYVISDGELTDQASVSVAVSAANQAPQANDDTAQVTAGQSVTINVLSNDSDPDGDSLAITSVVATSGTVSIQDSQIFYTADSEFAGTAIITYTISDGALTNQATVSVAVTLPDMNAPPVANDDEASTSVSTNVVINVLNNDSDPNDDDLTITNAFVVSGGGSVSINSGLSLTYTSEQVSGVAILEYSITDGTASASANVTVTINEAPIIANDDAYTVVESASLSITDVFGVLSNDTNQGSTVTLINGPSHASSFSLNPDGSFDYVHDGSLVNSDSFLYETAGNGGESLINTNNVSQALVTINIVRSNFLPQICSVPAATARVDLPFTQTIEVRDEDGGNTTSFEATFPSWLTFFDNFDGTATLKGTPSASDVGQFDVSVYVTDDAGASDTFNAHYVVEENALGFSDAFPHLAANFGVADHFVRDMTRDKNGNLIVVGGDNTNRFIVLRLTPEGSLDSTFASSTDVDGDSSPDPGLDILFEDATSTTLATAVKVLDNNKIVIAGIVNDSGNEIGIVVLNPDGTLDTSFGGDGIVRADPTGSFSAVVTDMEITDNQYVTVIGHFSNSNNESSDIFAAQYDFNGNPNLAFGSNGLLVIEQTGEQLSRASLQDQEGHIYILASEFIDSVETIVISRISSLGFVDLTFDTDGVFNFSDGTDLSMFDMAFDVDGGLLVAGSRDFDMAVTRFKIIHDEQSGQDTLLEDTTYSNNAGFLVVPRPSSNDRVTQLVADQQGAFFLLGQQESNGVSVTAVAKVLESGDLDTSYGESGVRLSDASNDSMAFGSEVAGALNAYGQLIIAQTAASGGMNNTVRVEQFSQQAAVASYGSCDVVAPCISSGSSFDQLYATLFASNNALIAIGDSSSPFGGNQYLSLAKFDRNFVFDTGFGDKGTGLTTFEIEGRDLFVGGVSRSDNGDLVVLLEAIDEVNDSLVLVMYDANGQLVSSFGINGVQDFADGIQGLPIGVAFSEADSRIVLVSGVDDTTFEVRQFALDGTPDTNFANSGLLTITNDLFVPIEFKVNNLGEIFTLGTSFNDTPARAIIGINKVNADGTIDTGFGDNGLLVVDLGDTSSLFIAGFEIVNNHFYIATIDSLTAEVRIVALDPTGALDTSFNPNGSSGAGVLSLGTHSEIFDFTQDADGNLILGLDTPNPGTLVDEIIKIDTAGRLDGRFINGGRGPIIGRPNGWNSYQHITAMPTGELVLGGESVGDFAIAMTDQAGAVINTVHELTIDFGLGDRANAVSLDSASRLILGGAVYDASVDDFNAALQRVLDTGSIDSSFSFIDDQPEQEMFFDVTAGSAGKITAFGGIDDIAVANNAEVIGVRTIGNSLALDASFGGGRVTEELSPSAVMSEFGEQLVLDNGSIFIVGSIDGNASVAKFDAQGALDSNFASSGILTLTSMQGAHFNSVTLDGNGDLIAGGYQQQVLGGNRDMLFVKFDQSGVIDTNFGTSGIALSDFNGDDRATKIVTGPDGTAYVVGVNGQGNLANIILVKLTESGQLDSTFGFSGALIILADEVNSAIKFDNYGAFWVALMVPDNKVSLLRLTSDGSVLQNIEANAPGVINLIRDIEIDALGNIYVVGNAQIHTASGNMWDLFSLRFPQAVGSIAPINSEVSLVETVSD